MRKNFIQKFCLIASAFLATTMMYSCNKQEKTSCPNKTEVSATDNGSTRSMVAVSIDGLGTRASQGTRAVTTTATESEKAYTSAVILAYRGGKLVDYKQWSGSAVKFALPTGAYNFYAILNAGTGFTSSVGTESSLLTQAGSLSNELTHFTMYGKESNVNVQGQQTISIHVKRFVSKIVLNSISAHFSSSVDAGLPFKILKVYLQNVVGSEPYANLISGSPASTATWYNKNGYSSSDVDRLIYKDVNTSLSNGDTYSSAITLYSFPNTLSSDPGTSSWSARPTRLMIVASLGGQTMYYPITLSLEMNKIYTVNVNITRRGNDNATDNWSDYIDNMASIIVDDWDNGGEMNVTRSATIIGRN